MIQLLKKIGTIMSLTGFGFKINEVINHTLRGQFFTYANLNIKNLYSLFVLAISIYKYFMYIKNIYTLDIMYIIIIMYDTILLFIIYLLGSLIFIYISFYTFKKYKSNNNVILLILSFLFLILSLVLLYLALFQLSIYWVSMNGNPGPNNNNPGNGGNWGYGNPGPNRGKPKSNINLRLLRKKPSNEKINNKDIMEHHAKFHRKLDEHLDKLYFNNATTAVKEFDNLYIEFKNQKEFNNKLDWSKLLDLYFCTHHKNPMGIANADPDLLIKTLKDGSPIELGEKFQEVLGKNYNPGELHTYLLIIKLVSDKSI